jgi:HEAT repeat protein
LGAAIVPRLLEMLVKTHEYHNTAEMQTILQALDMLHDERAFKPLTDLVGQRGPEPAQVFALGTLGAWQDPRAFDVIQSAFVRQENSANIRAAAAVALGRLGDARASSILVAALVDTSEDDSVRRNAARGLGYLSDPQSSAALIALLQSDQPPEFALTLVQSLGRIGGTSVQEILAQIERTGSDPTVRRAAGEAQRNLRA